LKVWPDRYIPRPSGTLPKQVRDKLFKGGNKKSGAEAPRFPQLNLKKPRLCVNSTIHP
jgi:hypothetical protein